MRLPIFVLLLAVGLVATGLAVRGATSARTQSEVEFATAAGGGGVGVWLLTTIGAFNVVSVSNGTEITHSYPGLAVLGVVGIGVSMLVLAKGSLELLRTQ